MVFRPTRAARVFRGIEFTAAAKTENWWKEGCLPLGIPCSAAERHEGNPHPPRTGPISALALTRKLKQTGYQEGGKDDPTNWVGDHAAEESAKRDAQ